MRTLALVFMLALMLAPIGCAQGPKAGGPGKRNALDKAALEAYLRHIELFRGPVNFHADDPKPSKTLPGFSDVVVHWSYEGGGRDDLYYISPDGQSVIKGDIYNINQNPFQANLEKLNTADAPSFGATGSPRARRD